MAEPVRDWVVSPHGLASMQRRGIGVEVVGQVMAAPEHRFSVRAGRDVLQSRLLLDGRMYLVRIFVDVDRSPPEVVTAYRSSKIEKYWSSQS